MTKEELIEKAQELTIKNVTDGKSKYYSWGYYKGSIVGLEYNNKRIEELEAKYYSVSEIAYHRGMCCISALRENRELEKENAELKDEMHTWKEASSTNSYKAFQLQEENKTLSKHILELQKDKGELTDRCRELEVQIEKMKNWCNCKNYKQCLIELAEQGKGMKPSECCVNCKKWELEDYKTRHERRNKEIKEND